VLHLMRSSNATNSSAAQSVIHSASELLRHSMAEPLLDVAAQRQLQTLVKKATDKRAFSLDPALLRDIKGMCRADDANVRTAFDAISEALKATHSQVGFRVLPGAEIMRCCRAVPVFVASLVRAFSIRLCGGWRSVHSAHPPAHPVGSCSRRSTRRRHADDGVVTAQTRLLAVELADVLSRSAAACLRHGVDT
jgi:hypothetical protein